MGQVFLIFRARTAAARGPKAAWRRLAP